MESARLDMPARPPSIATRRASVNQPPIDSVARDALLQSEFAPWAVHASPKAARLFTLPFRAIERAARADYP